jgi:hypothetical protein
VWVYAALHKRDVAHLSTMLEKVKSEPRGEGCAVIEYS